MDHWIGKSKHLHDCAELLSLCRDPGKVVPIIDACLAAIDAGRPNDALTALHQLITLVGDTALTNATPRPFATH